MAAAMTRWNASKELKLLSLVSAGKCTNAIARTLNMTTDQIERKCKTLHVEPHAYSKPEKTKAASTRRKRECLHCHSMFMSSGPGNRICKSCKNVVASNSGSFENLYLSDGNR